MRTLRHDDPDFASTLRSFQRTAAPAAHVQQTVAGILADVRANRDASLWELNARFGGPAHPPRHLPPRRRRGVHRRRPRHRRPHPARDGRGAREHPCLRPQKPARELAHAQPSGRRGRRTLRPVPSRRHLRARWHRAAGFHRPDDLHPRPSCGRSGNRRHHSRQQRRSHRPRPALRLATRPGLRRFTRSAARRPSPPSPTARNPSGPWSRSSVPEMPTSSRPSARFSDRSPSTSFPARAKSS